MIEIGRICLKLAGRDAGREAVVVDILDGNYVLVDGNVRRKKCNILHLEPTSRKIEIEKGASHEEVKKEFSKLKIPVWETKPKQKTEKPKKKRKTPKELNVQKEEKKRLRDLFKPKKKEENAEEKQENKFSLPQAELEKKEEAKEAEFKVLEEKENEEKKAKTKKEEKPAAKERKPIDARIVSVTKRKEKKKTG